jgi:hypothetical protein
MTGEQPHLPLVWVGWTDCRAEPQSLVGDRGKCKCRTGFCSVKTYSGGWRIIRGVVAEDLCIVAQFK